MGGGMASSADGRVMLGRLHLVRIVTSRASHLACPKASRLAQAVSGVSDLETIPLGIGSAIEINRIIAERLSRPIRKWCPIVPSNRVRHVTAGRLQMALHAHVELPVAIEPGGVHDVPGAGGGYVRASGSVTALAVDGRRLASLRAMAEQAIFGNDAAKVLLIGTVVAWTHRPVAALFGIPTYWQFD